MSNPKLSLTLLKVLKDLMLENPTWGDNGVWQNSFCFMDNPVYRRAVECCKEWKGSNPYVWDDAHNDFINFYSNTLRKYILPYSTLEVYDCQDNYWFRNREERLEALDKAIADLENIVKND